MTLPQLANEAARMIREAEEAGGPGAAKRKRVVDQLAKRLDELVTFGDGPIGRIAELFDGPAIRFALGLLVEGVLAGMRARSSG